jgi:hypothetical protein
MTNSIEAEVAEGDDVSVAVDMPVVVYPGTDQELKGTVVEDFGEMAGSVVEVAGQRIAEAARRWAVDLENGNLVFVDDDSIAVDTERLQSRSD